MILITTLVALKNVDNLRNKHEFNVIGIFKKALRVPESADLITYVGTYIEVIFIIRMTSIAVVK